MTQFAFNPILSTCPSSSSTTTPPARIASARHPARPVWTGSVAWLSPRSLPHSVKCPSARSSSWTAGGNGCSPVCSPRGGSAWRCRCFFPWAYCSTSPRSAASSAAGIRVATEMRARSESASGDRRHPPKCQLQFTKWKLNLTLFPPIPSPPEAATLASLTHASAAAPADARHPVRPSRRRVLRPW